MMMNRRQFLARSAMFGAAAWLAASPSGRLLAAGAQGKALGIQLYMVLKSYQADPLGTLKTRLHASLTELRARLNAQATA